MEMVHDRYSTLLTEFGTVLTTILPILFQYCYKYCYSDSRNLWAVMKAGGLAFLNLIQPIITLEMPVPSQGHYVFTVFRLLTDFVCLYTYEFWLSLWKIVLSSVILLLPLCKQTSMESSLTAALMKYGSDIQLKEKQKEMLRLLADKYQHVIT